MSECAPPRRRGAPAGAGAPMGAEPAVSSSLVTWAHALARAVLGVSVRVLLGFQRHSRVHAGSATDAGMRHPRFAGPVAGFEFPRLDCFRGVRSPPRARLSLTCTLDPSWRTVPERVARAASRHPIQLPVRKNL